MWRPVGCCRVDPLASDVLLHLLHGLPAGAGHLAGALPASLLQVQETHRVMCPPHRAAPVTCAAAFSSRHSTHEGGEGGEEGGKGGGDGSGREGGQVGSGKEGGRGYRRGRREDIMRRRRRAGGGKIRIVVRGRGWKGLGGGRDEEQGAGSLVELPSFHYW